MKRPAGRSLVGRIVHYPFRDRDQANVFGVVVAEQSDTVVIVHVATRRVSGDHNYGWERPDRRTRRATRWTARKTFTVAGDVVFTTLGPAPFRFALWDGRDQPYRLL